MVVLVMVVGSALDALGVAMVMPLIKVIQNPEALQQRLPWLRGWVPQPTNVKLLVVIGLALVIFYIIKNLILAGSTYQQARFIYRTQTAISLRLLNGYLRAPWTFYLQHNSAELLRNLTQDVIVMSSNVLYPLLVLITEGLVTLAILGMLILVDPVTSATALAVLGLSSALFYWLIRHQTDVLGKRHETARGNMIRWLNQGIGGNKEIRVLGREAFFVDAYAKDSDQAAEAAIYVLVVSQLPRFYLETLIAMGVFAAMLSASMRGQMGASFMPTLALLGAATFRLVPAINRAISTVANIRYHRHAVATVHRDMKALTAGLADGGPHTTSLPRLSFTRQLEVQDVSYQYAGASAEALSHVSFVIPRGASIAVEGPSGAGKTTLVDVILGLLPPSAGRVVVDGVNIRSDVRAWQRIIGYIPQAIYLADVSIRSNVAFGIPEERIDDQLVWRALRHAQLDDVVKALPEGFNTAIGEHGIRLSGGQRQRLGIARALYHDPEVLVLDEATSSLDSETEDEVTRAIQGLRGRKTLIIISHRRSTTAKCDVKYMLQCGALVRTITAAV